MRSRLPLAFSALAVVLSTAVSSGQVPQRPPARDAAVQAPSTATGRIDGVVVAADTGRIVRRATVSIAGVGQPVSKAVIADDQGVFTFTGLAAGSYTLTGAKAGLLDSIYGQRHHAI